MTRLTLRSSFILHKARPASAKFPIRPVGSAGMCRRQRLFASCGMFVLSATASLGIFLPATMQTVWAATVTKVTAVGNQDALSDNAQLRERVEQWWTARANGDHRTMYELYSPQFRFQRPYESFVAESVARARIPLDGFEIIAFQADGSDRALAKLKLHLVVPMGRVTTDVEEDWIVSDGRWYKFYKPAMTPRPPTGMQGRIVVPDAMREQAAPAK